MTTTPTKKLKESNFGFIHYTSALSHYMESDFNIAMEVFSILENKNLYCMPCTKIGLSKCPVNHFKCMNEIKFDII